MDEVEAVARVVAPMMEGGRELDQMPKDRRELKIWRASGMCSTNDATQDDATELAQAAIAALDAARGEPVARVVEWLRDQTVGDAEIDGGIAALADAIERGEPFNG